MKPVAAPEPFNLLAPKNGGALLVAPNDTWQAANDDKETFVESYALVKGREAVFGFQDGRPASFDTFAMLVNAARSRNVKEVELSVGDDSPTGAFRTFANCTFENAKLLRSPYQQCKFDPVTARFLKVKVVSSFSTDNYFHLEEWRLFGKLEASGTASAVPTAVLAKPSSDLPAPAPVVARPSLISPKNGGALLVAPNDTWHAANDEKEALVESYALVKGQEAVFGFSDDRSATFDTFAVLINAARGRNVKEVELLVGDNGPTGTFRAFANCTFQNAKLLRSPYQECKFAPITARFLKVKVLSTHANDNYFHLEEWRLFGAVHP